MALMLTAFTWMAFALVLVWLINRKPAPTTRNQLLAVYPDLDLTSQVICPETRPAVESKVLTTNRGRISDDDLFYRLMGEIEDNNTFKTENQRLANQVKKLELELSTSKSQHDDSQSVLRDELNAARCQLDAKNRDIAQLESTILDMKNNQTALKNDAKVDADRIEGLNVQYQIACVRIASMHREVRSLCSARAVLQREKRTLVNELQMKTREHEEEKASSHKKLEDLQTEHNENLIKVRDFHLALLSKRNLKIDELQETITQLNLTIDEYEDDHRTEMEEMRTRFSIAIKKRNEHLLQLESTIEELTKKNCELNEAIDELELGSYELPDYYKLLDVKREASEDEIKAAYKTKIRLAHPDKVSQMRTGAINEKVLNKTKRLSQTLNRAKEILNEPRLKYQYDSWLDMTELKKTESEMRDYQAYEDRKRSKNY